MPLVTSQELLENAQKGKYAVGAFNVENMEMVLAAIEAAQELKAPIILQTTPSTVRYASLKQFYASVKAAAEDASVPVALHLDHGNSFELVMQALRIGYTSLMIDGSHLDFEGNIELTKRVVDAAKPSNIPVEAELGKVGGKEDDLDVKDAAYTDPAQAKEFVERTGITSFAVAIGTAHGFYKGIPKLDIDRLIEIRKVVDIPLVLHGASGLLDRDLERCIEEGICKINFATELRVAFSNGVKSVLRSEPEVHDPKVYLKAAKENVKQLVKNRITVCGCQRKY